jgi:NAD(P)-dependent dehydrogenase (short-subunit alcohol dehydrogenase family)
MGGNVAVLDLRETPLDDVFGLAKQFKVKAEYFQADVSDEQSLRAAFDKAIKALGGIDGK